MKNTLRIVAITLLFLISSLFSTAQNKTIDSLKLALKSAKHDTTRCIILYELLGAVEDEEFLIYNKKLLSIADKNIKTETNKIFFLKQSALTYNDVGLWFFNRGNIITALEYYYKALHIEELLQNKVGIARSFNNIGRVYSEQGDGDKAIEYFEKSLKSCQELNHKVGIGYALNNIGAVYYRQHKVDKALEYYQKSLFVRKENNDLDGIAQSFQNIGVVYDNQGNFSEALVYYEQSLKIREELNNPENISLSLGLVATCYLYTNKLNQAYSLANKAMQIANDLGYPELITRSAQILKNIFREQNKFKQALEMYELEIQMRDSINNQETKRAAIKKQFQYQYEKKAAADSVKNVEEQKVKNAQLNAQQAQLKQEKTQRFALYGGLVLVIVFSGFVYNRFRITQKQKAIIEKQKHEVDSAYEKLHEKNKEVMDSIRYAARIQRSLITSEKYIASQLGKLRRLKGYEN